MSSTRFRRCLSSVIIACVTVSVTASGASQVFSQGDEDFAKGPLRALIESQLNKQRRKHNQRDSFRPTPPAPSQPTQQVRQRLDEISDELTALKQIIGVTIPWDRHEMLLRPSNLESIAKNIRRTIEQWHRTAGIRDAHRTAEARQLISHCHELEQLIGRRRQTTQIREECNHVIETWQHLRPYLRKCRTYQRATLQELAERFTPKLVRILTAVPE